MGTEALDSTAPPRVSMVMPVHNGARWLADAIDSVLAQDFADFELILVDDASRDASPAIMAQAAARDPRVRLLRLDANVGLPAALNHGFAAARGDLHSWTSDDNILRPAMLRRLVATLDTHPDADVAHADFMLIDEAGSDLGRSRVGPIDRLLYGNNIGACFLYRARVTEALGGYDTQLFGVEDYDFWLRAAQRFTFVALHEDLYLYRKHGGSLTSQRAEQIQALTAKVVERALPAALPARSRSEILLGLALRSSRRWRLDLVRRAFRADPWHVAARLPALARWSLVVARNRMAT
ncbi:MULTISPECIES: glycosyltransferase [unclassified Sphingopyxis]|uniref:glycosyltransferase family 2 protein n=1 Tax=unclassified Sphingopyxis TaxID=2614943 RepID=UPI002866FE10|nr:MULTISPECIES: glycosyltransferase [unclassified Sphingopyxis]MDR6833583.1 glycosyltransferase involved in cell wall biosynthesis [Sphingopyxis sp. BE122]MDR7225852.1 glycosyltransferase involved in cell wall biosynthesis [Sphingopyxis sp. BE259]